MVLGRAYSRLAHVWQLPLLLISVILFGFAAYLLMESHTGLTVDQRLAAAAGYLRQERPEAAIGQIDKLLENSHLDLDRAGRAHLMLAEALAAQWRSGPARNPANDRRIIEETRQALADGVRPTAEVYRRLGESCAALGETSDAAAWYRQAMGVDADHVLHLERQIVELELASEDWAAAGAGLERYLRRGEITDSERSWAVGEQAHLLIERGSYTEAQKLLAAALTLPADGPDAARLQYWLGYCAWRLGEAGEAQTRLAAARRGLGVGHPLEADTCYILGKISQDGGDAARAEELYDVVLQGHGDSAVAPLAQLGRALCRLSGGHDEGGLADLHELVCQTEARRPQMPHVREELLMGLQRAAAPLMAHENFQGALTVLGYERELRGDVPAAFYGRLALALERRADQVERGLAGDAAAERIGHEQEVRDCRTGAGDAWLACARLAGPGDPGDGRESLWKGIDLYERAGETPRAMSALEQLIAQRPDDELAGEAYLRLGKAYQAAGRMDKAIAAYQQEQFRFPQSVGAARVALPLARAYLAKGPEFASRAETALLGAVESHGPLTARDEDFRGALLELAQLYYRSGRFEEAAARLEELGRRCPEEARSGAVLFLTADSYRRIATAMGPGPTTRATEGATGPATTEPVTASALASAEGGGVPADTIALRRDRLAQAKALYDRVIEAYANAVPADEQARKWQKLSHYYRADCLYEMGEYEEAIHLYEAAALRYPDDASSVAAYVQIVNAYQALGKSAEAQAASERARQLLRKLPAAAVTEATMPREYWDRWVQWTGQMGTGQ